jgi:hypothetical protein
MIPLPDHPIPLFILLPGGKPGSALRRGALIHLPDQPLSNECPKLPGTNHRNRLDHPP